MVRIQKEDDVLLIDHVPQHWRILCLVYIAVGFGVAYYFSLTGRMECQRTDSGGTCTLYQSSFFHTGTQTFPVQDLSMATAEMVGPKAATRIELTVEGRPVEFSTRNSSGLIGLAAEINEFIGSPTQLSLDVAQKTDLVFVFLGLFFGGSGLVLLLGSGHSTRIRFDAQKDKVTITHRGFPKNKEFNVSDIDHLDHRGQVLMLVFHDGTFHKEGFTSDLREVWIEIDAYIKEHFPKGDLGNWK